MDASAGDDSGAETDAGPTTPDAGPSAPHVLEPYATTSHWNEHELYPAIRAAGVRMIRVDVSWNNVQPSPGGFEWSNIDQAMTAAADADIEVLAVLGYTNSWATSDNGGGGEETQYAPKEEYDDEWAAYIEATVSRYADQVAAWEIWNEPDHDNFLRIGDSTWAGNHHSGESAVDIKRLEYQHLLELALAAPSLAGKTITTSGFAEGGDWDTGMRAWLESQNGFLNRFGVASFHCYGFPSYQRLIDVPASYRQTQEAIAKADPWPFWITEHGIPQMGVDGGVIKTYLIRSYAIALAQENVEKLFWFRAGYDPVHRDLFDASRNPTDAYRAMQTLSGKWDEPTSVAAWESSGSARGSIATLANGTRMAIVRNDGDAAALDSLGLNIASAHDQNGDTLATNAALGGAPVFLTLTD